jgi:hypothetical protein
MIFTVTAFAVLLVMLISFGSWLSDKIIKETLTKGEVNNIALCPASLLLLERILERGLFYTPFLEQRSKNVVEQFCLSLQPGMYVVGK